MIEPTLGAEPIVQEVLVKLSTPPEPMVSVLPLAIPRVPTATFEVARLLMVTLAEIAEAVVFSLMLSVAREVLATMTDGE